MLKFLKPVFKISTPKLHPTYNHFTPHLLRQFTVHHPTMAPLIGTHNGHFHADEALAVYLLRLLPAYASSPLVRTRDPAVLETCHTVVDVGGEYDVSRNRFDHHQRGFNEVFPGRNTKLSAAGLVYLEFGKDIISVVTGLKKDSSDAALLHKQMYVKLIEAFDGNDNGVDLYDSSGLESAGLKPKYDVTGFSMASVVRRLFQRKGDEKGLPPAEIQKREDERFEKASQFVGEQFISELSDLHSSWLPARAVVREAFANRYSVHPGGQILVIPHKDEGVPWSDHLYAAEEEEGKAKVLYVLFPENGTPDSKWRIRSVSVASGGFKNRKDMPDAWKGLRDEQLSQVSGIPGGVFVHASGFIGGNQTYDGVLKMAIKAVES
jgi:uncharacterized UPF0160 family protein